MTIGAIYTIGLNYRDPRQTDLPGPERPLVYGKASSALTAAGSVVRWDRSLTANVNGECELGVIVGPDSSVQGYTIVNDITSQDAWLDGDQWLLGKSMPGFSPVGPEMVMADEIDASDLRLGLTVNDVVIQDGRTSDMRFGIGAILQFLSAHIRLLPGDLIATGTPPRIGPDASRHLAPGDTMKCWIEGIGELTNRVE